MLSLPSKYRMRFYPKWNVLSSVKGVDGFKGIEFRVTIPTAIMMEYKDKLKHLWDEDIPISAQLEILKDIVKEIERRPER